MLLGPSLWSGWYGDDAWYSGLPGALAAGKTTLWGAIGHSFWLWATQNGRFYPGQIAEKYLVFALFTDRFAYKCLLLVSTLVALETARRFFASLWGRDVANAAALVACVCFQERAYEDPFLSQNAMLQVVTILVFASLAALRRFLDTGRGRVLAASIIWFVLAASTYEITYFFGIFHVLLGARYGRTRAALPFLGIGVAFASVSLVLRRIANVPAVSIYAFRPDPHAYARALADQIAGALPLDYVVADPHHIFPALWPFPNAAQLPVSLPLAVLLAAVGALIFWTLRAAPAPPSAWSQGAFAAALIVLPALSLPLTVKYQNELRPGIAYLPVFIEELGVGLAAAALVAAVARRAPRLATGCFALVFAAAGTITQAANRIVVDGIDREFLVPRVALERAAARGVFRGVPAGTRIAFEPAFSWTCRDDECPDGIGTADVVFRYSGKRLRVVAPAGADDILAYDASARTWRLRPSRSGGLARPAAFR